MHGTLKTLVGIAVISSLTLLSGCALFSGLCNKDESLPDKPDPEVQVDGGMAAYPLPDDDGTELTGGIVAPPTDDSGEHIEDAEETE